MTDRIAGYDAWINRQIIRELERYEDERTEEEREDDEYED